MDILESYQKGLQNILMAKSQIFQILDSVQTSFHTANKTFDNVKISLLAIDSALPSKRNPRKNRPKEEKNSLENMENHFNANWAIIFQSLIPPPGLQLFNETIVQSIVNDIESIKIEYSTAFAPIEIAAQASINRLSESDDRRKTAYAQYAALCKQINDASQKPDGSSEVENLKSNYQSVLEKALEAHSEYEKEAQIFENKVEELFSQYEKIDAQAFKRVVDVISSTNGSLNSMRQELNQVNDIINNVLSDPNNLTEYENYFAKSPLSKSQPLQIRYNPQQLRFKVDDFIPPKKLYEGDLKAYKAKVLTEYKAKKAKECDVTVGEIVYVIKKKGLSSKVFVSSTQQVGYVPSRYLEHYSGQSPQLMRVVTAYNDISSGTAFEVNQIVCQVGVENSNALCINPYYSSGQIPLLYITPI